VIGLTIYADESGTHDEHGLQLGSEVTAVAGYIADNEIGNVLPADGITLARSSESRDPFTPQSIGALSHRSISGPTQRKNDACALLSRSPETIPGSRSVAWSGPRIGMKSWLPNTNAVTREN
jgi:hypothetical protein